MPIELIPKERKIPPFQRIVFVSSVLILFIVLSLFGYFLWVTKKQEKIRDQLKSQFKEEMTPEEKALEKKIIFTETQLKKAKEILAKHTFPSKALDFIETNLNKDIYLTSLTLDLQKENPEIQLKGASPDFETLSLQIFQFRKQPEVKNVSVTELTREEENEIIFNIDLIFQENFFKEL